MKITETRMCIDCEEVFPDGAAACPACASRTTVLLAIWVPPISTLTKDLKTRTSLSQHLGGPGRVAARSGLVA